MSGAPPLDRATREPSRFVSALRAGIAGAVGLLLFGCTPPGTTLPESETGDLGAGNSLREWTDPTTGCSYFIYRNGQGNASTGGMTIRFRADGTADCPAAPSQGEQN